MTVPQWLQMRYFHPTEFHRPYDMQFSFMLAVDNFRHFIATPILVTSSNDPSEKHSNTSLHYPGRAIDLVAPGFDGTLLDLFIAATRFFGGIGVYPDWRYNGRKVGGLHVDDRDEPGFWLGIRSKTKKKLPNIYLQLNEANLRKYGVL